MKDFAQLYATLDASTSTRRKTQAMVAYFGRAAPADAAWAVYFLAGGRPGRPIPSTELRVALLEATGLPEWLFEESYQAVGDLAETIAHLLEPSGQENNLGLAQWITERILPIRGQPPETQRQAVRDWWQQTDETSRFVLNKLLTGGMRVGVSKLLVVRALAEAFELDAKRVSQRIMGYTDKKFQPDSAAFKRLVAPAASGPAAQDPELASQPYPFFLAHPIKADVESLGDSTQWQAEWKWDGIRGQLIQRMGQTWIWSRGEELMNERFPELMSLNPSLPDGTVLDGELLCWDHNQDHVLPFSILQQRIGRKNLTAKILNQAPVIFMAYDVLERNGVDVREHPQRQRRQWLEVLCQACAQPALKTSPLLSANDPAGGWDELAAQRERARELGVEGLMLKQLDALYGVGRTRNDSGGQWWKWKLDPMTVDCVLIYAQRGHGRRASLYTDYTFAVWDKPAGEPDRQLVPFAKAYSGLTDKEIAQVDAVIRKTTREKFGPVRSVEPTLVFELGFEGIAASSRHKSGIAVRFPRMLRERPDKTVEQADTLAVLRSLLPA
ncbi:MAG: ATP-dependent DNA ligase [Burkholderiaceae bacterium]